MTIRALQEIETPPAGGAARGLRVRHIPRPRTGVVVLAIAAAVTATTEAVAGAPFAAWTETTWNGEQAFSLSTGSWRAVVSVERGRLVHFGPAGGQRNLLFSPATRDTPLGWGGHRVWLGPQTTWPAIWPPPAAWEASRAESVRVEDARLELVMPDGGDGWPRLTRVYELSGDQLACRIVVPAAGARDAQIIQIVQVPPPDELALWPDRSAAVPLGFVFAPPTGGRRVAAPVLELPAHATAVGDRIFLRRAEESGKYGFPPQPLIAVNGDAVLRVARGAMEGTEVGAPDLGFYTQVYLGATSTPLVELEQLSPLWQAGTGAEFTMLLDLERGD